MCAFKYQLFLWPITTRADTQENTWKRRETRQTCANTSWFLVILLLIGLLSMRFHFTNHNLLVCLRSATAITTFICFDRELEEKASFKPQLKSAVRESPLDFCRFGKFFKVSTGDFCFSRQTKTNTVRNYFSRWFALRSQEKYLRHVKFLLRNLVRLVKWKNMTRARFLMH